MCRLISEVLILVAKGWTEEDAIRVVAAKWDVPDYELALEMMEV